MQKFSNNRLKNVSGGVQFSKPYIETLPVDNGNNCATVEDCNVIDITLESPQEINDFIDYLEAYGKSKGASAETMLLLSDMRKSFSKTKSHVFKHVDAGHRSGFENFLKQKYNLR